MVLEQLDSHMRKSKQKKKKILPIPHSLYKNQLKMDQRPKSKT